MGGAEGGNTGGVVATGGGLATGGVVATGGGPAAGGVIATGGAPATGGVVAAGGGPAAGGAAQATGGAGTGGSSTPLCDTSWDTVPSKQDGLAMTPPMGWNSWNVFHENINETQLREIADALVSSGMKDAGYVYLNMDDNWMAATRDDQGNLVHDSTRFPNGIRALADYVHERGLKLGIYGDRGTETCFNRGKNAGSGSYGNEERDAATFASWGIDYLKYDNCAIAPGRDNDVAMREDYERMASALQATGRDILFSICAWDYKDWMPATGHLWRTTLDIKDCWHESDGCIAGTWETGIVQIIDENNLSAVDGGPGHWNDPDMLEVGNGDLSADEYRGHFSLWAIMAAPLIAGNDVRSMSEETRDILINEEVIAVDQDPGGIQGTRVIKNGDLEVWMKPLCHHAGPEKAVALFNRGGTAAEIAVAFDAIGVTSKATVRDLWAHQDLGEFDGSYSSLVPARGVVVVKIIDTVD